MYKKRKARTFFNANSVQLFSFLLPHLSWPSLPLWVSFVFILPEQQAAPGPHYNYVVIRGFDFTKRSSHVPIVASQPEKSTESKLDLMIVVRSY